MNPASEKRSKERIEIQDRDLDILEAVFEMRYVTVDLIAALFRSATDIPVINPGGVSRGGAEAIAKRLGKLSRFDYLSTVDPALRRPSESTLYYIGDESVKLLSERRGRNPAEINNHIRAIRKYLGSRSLKNAHFAHELGINRFHVALAVALRNHPTAGWLCDDHGAPFWAKPNDNNNLKKAVSVRVRLDDIPANARKLLKESTDAMQTITCEPDAFFILVVNGQRCGYLYEKDRGTVDHDRLALKFACYYHWYLQKGHYKMFGTNRLRILIETESVPRIDNMLKWGVFAVKENGSGIFWFTTTYQISLDQPERILDAIWTVGHRRYLNQKHSFIEFTPQQR
jgi:hypothetical protein